MMTAIVAIAVVGAILQGLFITVEHQKKFVAADVLKGLAAACFVVVGAIGFLTARNDSYALKIVIGLFFGMLGDILLNMRFIFGEEKGQKFFLIGIVAFLIGHILYLAALTPLATHAMICVAIGLALELALLIYIFSTMKVKLVFKIFGVFYLGAVIIMSVMAVDAAIVVKDVRSIECAVGAVLFMLSDIILIFNTFGGSSKFSARIANLSLYYIGQMMIAISLFL